MQLFVTAKSRRFTPATVVAKCSVATPSTTRSRTAAHAVLQWQGSPSPSLSAATRTTTSPPRMATLTIDPKAATVTANNKTKTYGDVNPTLTATVAGHVLGGDPINYTLTTTATQFSNVGGYAITVALGSNPNYNVTPTNGTLTVDPKAATVTADTKSKSYGDANPTLTATLIGEVAGGAAINYNLANHCDAVLQRRKLRHHRDAGQQPNYNVTPTSGTLTIDPKAATVTADNKSKVYGDINPTLTATVDGQVVGGEAVNYTLATSATQFSNAGSYAITVTLGTSSTTTSRRWTGH